MATTPTQTVRKEDGWVEITAASGLSGTVQNTAASAEGWYAETADVAPDETIEGMRLPLNLAFPKVSTQKAWVKAATGVVRIAFTEWDDGAA